MPRDSTRASGIALAVPDDLIDALAESVAQRVAAIRVERHQSPVSPWLTTDEAAAYIRASRQRVFDLTSHGRLTAHKDGTRNLYRREALDADVNGAMT